MNVMPEQCMLGVWQQMIQWSLSIRRRLYCLVLLERDRLDVKQLAQRYVVYNGMGVRKDLWNQMDPEGEVFGFLELIEEFGEEALKGGDEVKSQSSPIHERQDFDSLPKEVGGIALDAQQLKGFTLWERVPFEDGWRDDYYEDFMQGGYPKILRILPSVDLSSFLSIK